MARIRFSVFFSVFVSMVALMIIAPVMPPLIRELGLSEVHSGIIISLGSVAMAVMAPVWGRLSDLKGRKPVILMGFIGMFVSYVIFTATMYAGLYGAIEGGRAPWTSNRCTSYGWHVHSSCTFIRTGVYG